MTTRQLSRTVMAVFAALSDRAPAVAPTTRPRRVPARPAASRAPTIGHLSPVEGSTGGSTPLKISGSGFERGAAVFVDGIAVSAFVLDSHTIYACTPPHDAGAVDVVVANPDTLSAWETDAYTYVSPCRFDFNGDWVGVAGAEHQMELRFRVRRNLLISMSCGASGVVTFSPAPMVENGEFAAVRSDGVGISARIVSTSEAVGTINLERCPCANWIATRSLRQV